MRITAEHIEGIETFDDAQIELIADAFDKHPYSSTLAVILSKAYEQKGDIQYEDLIQRAALLSHSRKQLHSFLFAQADESAEPLNVPDSPMMDDLPTAEDIDLVARVDEKAEGSITLPLTEDKEAQSDEGLPLEETTPADLEDPLERLYLSEALGAGAALDLIDRLDDTEAEDTFSEERSKQPKKIPASVSDEEIVSRISPVDTSEESDNSTDEQREEPTTLPDRMSLSSWMTALSSDVAIQKKSESFQPSVLEELDSKDIQTKSFEEAASLIDNFIEKESDIVPKRAEFFNPAKVAKSSLQDREEIVSETLAGVYAAQGNFSKAISTYEKLSLLHPEKSSYFAALIEKLKTEKKHRS